MDSLVTKMRKISDLISPTARRFAPESQQIQTFIAQKIGRDFYPTAAQLFHLKIRNRQFVKSQRLHIGDRRAVINFGNARPVERGETHRARLGRGINFGAFEQMRFQLRARRPNRFDFGVRRRIVMRQNVIAGNVANNSPPRTMHAPNGPPAPLATLSRAALIAARIQFSGELPEELVIVKLK